MAKEVPRLHLFFGSDSRASLAELRRWNRLFRDKYGEATRFTIDADELSSDQVRKSVEQALSGQTLFAEPKLILLKRLSAADPKKGKVLIPFLDWLEAQVGGLDQSVTLLIWEDRDLPPDHALRQRAEAWAAKGKAAIRSYLSPGSRQVETAAQSFAAASGKQLDPAALAWLADQYRFLDRQTRLQLRLKNDQARLDDERTWWLFNLLEGAVLRSEGEMVTAADLEQGHQALGQPVGAFDIAAALASLRWAELNQLVDRFIRTATDDSAYFGLYAALAWQAQRGSARLTGRLRAQAIRLLGEIEVLSKSSGLDHAWLLERFFLALRLMAEQGIAEPIIRPRQVWLSTLPRS